MPPKKKGGQLLGSRYKTYIFHNYMALPNGLALPPNHQTTRNPTAVQLFSKASAASGDSRSTFGDEKSGKSWFV